ncbi:CRAL TRIO domain containing protein [Asbolus verrucosus]|uniref:CRAL TRIO domain containing protein n=1 Tax=Asbolus verrucosus TaxID=1661398 RepID=A0A482VZV6_ASBVE|nr:CRAL TRIO domain containing protein [Asbolus verrucosus]
MDLISVSQDEKDQVRKYYNINETQIKEDIDLIREWLKKQPHLPQNITDDFIEKVLLRNKFRVERTKQKLDNYYKLRGDNREFMKDFQNINYLCDTIMVGDRFVIDYAGFSLKHLTKLNPVILAKDILLIEEAYSCRILSLDFINLPSFVSKILALFRMVMTPKLYERVTLSIINQYISQEMFVLVENSR